MRVIYIFLIAGLFCSKVAYSKTNDSITIQGTLLNNRGFLLGTVQQFGAKKHKIKEFKIKEGFFSFSLPSSIEPGVYRLQFDGTNKKPYVDLIVDGIEDSIVFNVSIYGLESHPVFQVSEENQNWYAYLEKAKIKVGRLNELFNYLSMYHKEESGVDRSVIRIYQKERKQYYALFDDFIKVNSKSWSGLLVQNIPHYFSNLKKEPVERDFIRRNFFWEGIDTNNYKLINTPVYSELIDLYLDKYYLNQRENYNTALKEYHFKKGIDILIEKFSNNPSTEKFIRAFLEDFFINLKRQDLVDYVRQK